MAEEFSGSEQMNLGRPSEFEMELLAALLEPDDALYPWDTTDPESEAYFIEREREWRDSGWLEEDMSSSQTFFSTLDALWSTVAPSQDSNNVSGITNESAIRASLQQFAVRVPQDWIEAIAHRAQQAFSSQKALAQQLVDCVQELVPNWTEEDLLTLARPFAYAMRGTDTEAVDIVLEEVQQRTSWTELTEIEQARTSLALARYALSQIQAMRDER